MIYPLTTISLTILERALFSHMLSSNGRQYWSLYFCSSELGVRILTEVVNAHLRNNILTYPTALLTIQNIITDLTYTLKMEIEEEQEGLRNIGWDPNEVSSGEVVNIHSLIECVQISLDDVSQFFASIASVVTSQLAMKIHVPSVCSGIIINKQYTAMTLYISPL